ncbi:EGF-like domain protein [Ancylostoma ceylanicum]|uniref:Delta-like protein n=1 Tax=Ancylostoma ceylanicum TaxID=53326 RepID=A0A0D6LG53_9BILA|nr:EGF-like domain protein [Ancylostoma ceylanicum]
MFLSIRDVHAWIITMSKHWRAPYARKTTTSPSATVRTEAGEGQLSQNTSKERFTVGTEFKPAAGSSEFLDIAFRASCHSSYFGAGCQRYCKSSFSYTCDSEGRKICAEGWQGEQCDQPICPDGCKHGRCVEPGRCECDHGFFGSTCAECRRSENCRHGTCRDDQPFTCACEPGWGGIFCERDLEYCTRHQPCKNDGVCTNGGVRTDFTCQCPEGFVGATCDIELPSICEHLGICRNGGVCTDADTRLGRCICADGFEGRYCERRVVRSLCTATTCKNGGSCLDGSKCVCPQCLSGADCSTIDEQCLWQRANATLTPTVTDHQSDVTEARILMLMAFASIMMLATCVVIFFLKYKKMKRILRDPVTQNTLNEHRQIHELPNRSIDNRSPDEVYKVFVIPSKKSKDVDGPASIEYETRYISQPRGRYRTLPCVDVSAAAEPEHHYAEIEYRPTTVSLDDKQLADNACSV